jgi:hypothetical protein
MSLRIPTERISPLALFLQALRSVICGAVILIAFFSLVQADPDQTSVAIVLRDGIQTALNL